MPIFARFVLTVLITICTSLFSFADNASNKRLHIYNWAEYIDPALLDKFTKETGITVILDTFDSNEFLLTRMLAGKTGYDLIVPGTPFLTKMIEAGVVQPLDFDKIPNAKHRWEVINKRIREFPDAERYSVNWMWGTTGIGYNVKAFNERMPKGSRPDTLAMIFDPTIVSKFADCGVYLLDTADEVIPAALKYAGLDPSSTRSEDLKVAEDILRKIRPYIRKFDPEHTSPLAAGDICLSLSWSGDVIMGKERAISAKNGVEIDFAIPKEGALIWMDQLSIPKDASNPEAAHQFINFIMRPENNAQAQIFLTYASGNSGSHPLLPASLLNNRALFPDEDTMQNLYTKLPYSQRDQKIITRLWTRIKSQK